MILTLIKTRLAATFSGMMKSKKGNKTRSKGMIALFIILFIYLAVVFIALFASMFTMMAEPFEALGMGWLYYAMAGLMAFALCFIGSVFMAQHQIFEARDNELLLSMPIKPSAILISRMVSIYFFNLIYTLLIMAPALVVRLIILGMTAYEIILFILATLLIPMMSMAFSCLFGWILAMISAKMRNKNTITMILSVGFMALYFYFCTNLSNYITALAENGASIGEAIRKAVFPAYHMGVAIHDGKLLSIIIFIACAVIPFLVALYFINRNFIKITTTKAAAAKVKYKEKALRAQGVKKALLIKELKRFLGSAAYVLNAGMGLILMLVLTVALVINRDAILAIASQFGMFGISAPAIVCMLLCVCSSMNIISAPSISIESKTLWLMKSLPVSAFDALMAKAGAHFSVCAIGILACGTVANIVVGSSVGEAVMMYIMPLCYSAFTAVADLLINLHMPKFDWINEAACVKQGGSVIVSMLVNMAVVAIPLVVYFVALISAMSPVVFLIIASAFFAALAALTAFNLKTSGVKIFESL